MKSAPLLHRLIFIPLILFLLGYGSITVRAFLRERDISKSMDLLFSDKPLSLNEIWAFQRLKPEEIQSFMEDWSDARKEAAYLLIDFKNIPVDFDKPEIKNPSETPHPLITMADSLFAAGDYDEAEACLREYWLIEFQSENIPAPADLLLKIRNAVLKTDEAAFWLDMMSSWPGFKHSSFEAAFLLASCYEILGDIENAFFWYDESAIRSSHWKDVRRAQWYALRLLTRHNPDALHVYIPSQGQFRNEDGYFDDLFDEYFSTLVRQGRWREFQGLIPLISDAGFISSTAQGLFLLERAYETRLIQNPPDYSLYPDIHAEPSSYYALRSQADEWPFVLERSESETSPAQAHSGYWDELYSYLINAGFLEEAYLHWERERPALGLTTIQSFSKYLKDTGNLYDLIRFAGYWYYTLPSHESHELIAWVFPGGNKYEIPDLQIPSELILGIIRRESAFHESISSRVGAQGLMQLMPSTAEDLAHKNKIEDWDLHDPEDNILFGALYLLWLKERPWTDNYAEILAAYNGGGGNLRKWKRLHGFEDPDLFIQSIPFRETRDYVRKVIVAAAAYRFLDERKVPGKEWLAQFYQSFPGD